jgi:hypothetical protein
MIIDEENILIVWHGRLEAFKKLWYKKNKLLKVTWLTENQKKDYRIRDNTTNLLSEFDLENIRKEILDIWDNFLRNQFYYITTFVTYYKIIFRFIIRIWALFQKSV